MIDLIQIDLQRKLANLNKNNFATKNQFQLACLKLADQAKKQYTQYANFCLTNAIACNSKELKSNRQISRYVWDCNQMNFN